MLTIHMKCDKCGSSLEEGYEILEHGRDENGYMDEEILCGRCAQPQNWIELVAAWDRPRTMLVIDGDKERAWDFENAGNAFARCFFHHPERIQIESIRYSEAAQ